jgi:hypothetical protein
MYSLGESIPDDALVGIDLEGGSSFSLPSDFYCEARDVTRGVTLDACDLNLHSGDGYQYDMQSLLCRGDAGLKAKDLYVESDFVRNIADRAIVPTIPRPAFFQDDEAPTPPDDDLFKLELTTLTVQGRSAAEIANETIHILDKKVESSWVKKASRKKLAITAEVCLEASYCEIKVRIYRASGVYLIEMQRRHGDIIAFNRLWQVVSENLNSCMTSVGALCIVPQISMQAVKPIIPEEISEDVDSAVTSSLQPLLRLAECSNPNLQAEAMLALAHAAKRADVAKQMCTPQVFALLKNMSGAVCFHILEPLSRLVGLLSALPQARDFPEMQHLQKSMKAAPYIENACAQVY